MSGAESRAGIVLGRVISDDRETLEKQLRELQRDSEVVSMELSAAEERVAQLKRQRMNLLEMLHHTLAVALPPEEAGAAAAPTRFDTDKSEAPPSSKGSRNGKAKKPKRASL